MKERETPAGVFAIVEKDKDHHSTMYDDAWMPNMQRITWNGLALHGGPLPGYAASHGCVRMPFGFAEKLFDKTRIGMRVIVAPEDATPVDISHPVLFVPNAETIAAIPAKAETRARDAAQAAAAADEAKKTAAATAREAAPVAAALKKLQLAKTRADAELASAEKALAKATTDQAKAKAEERKQKAAAKATEVSTQLDTVKAEAAAKLDAAAAAKEANKTAQTKKSETASAALDAKLAAEPVSVYISRATRTLYVRRNTHKPAPDGGGEVFDTSIEVLGRNPRSRQTTRHAYFHGDGAQRQGTALDQRHHRWWRRRQERARPHHHSASCARSHRADRIAALLDRDLGRAAERGNQLSHRVRRGAE